MPALDDAAFGAAAAGGFASLEAVGLAAGGLAGAAAGELCTLIERKSTFAARAALSSWYTSEGTSAFAGTALPSRATVA